MRARHACATLMHLQGVPVVVIAAWVGRKDANLTLQLYAHSQRDALKAAGATLNRLCHRRVREQCFETLSKTTRLHWR
jgi:integrase